MVRYWEKETPITIKTGKNVLEYYRDAEKLSVARQPWTDSNGTEQRGKTVMFDIAALTECGVDGLRTAREVFSEIISSIDERLDLIGG